MSELAHGTIISQDEAVNWRPPLDFPSPDVGNCCYADQLVANRLSMISESNG